MPSRIPLHVNYSTLKSVWGEWLSQTWDWDWYCTLTFRDPPEQEIKRGWTKIGLGYANKAWDKFVKELELREGSFAGIYWLRGVEIQRNRAVPHFHALVGRVRHLRRMDMVDWWWDRYGIARILEYDPRLGAGWYLCKYVVKELGDIKFSEGLENLKLGANWDKIGVWQR